MHTKRMSALAATTALVAAALAGCSTTTASSGSDGPASGASTTLQSGGRGLERAGGALPLFDEADKDGDGKVTLAEARALAGAQFAIADSNKDGLLDDAELSSFAGAWRQRHHAERIQALDTDRSGTISKSEATPRLQAMFDELDANHDGVLDQQELSALPGSGPGGGMGPRMARLDTDGDGKVSASELTAGAERLHARADENSDGVVTREEAMAVRGGRGGFGFGPHGPGPGGPHGFGPGGPGPGRGAMLDKIFADADTNNDGSVSRAELDALRAKHFAAADTNGDRELDASEVAAWRQKMHASGAGGPLAMHDDDADGALTRDELPPRLQARFAELDKNKDGKLSQDELPAGRPFGMGRGMMARMDANGDGKISADEFEAMPARWFARADANGDGAVTRDELRAAAPPRNPR